MIYKFGISDLQSSSVVIRATTGADSGSLLTGVDVFTTTPIGGTLTVTRTCASVVDIWFEARLRVLEAFSTRTLYIFKLPIISIKGSRLWPFLSVRIQGPRNKDHMCQSVLTVLSPTYLSPHCNHASHHLVCKQLDTVVHNNFDHHAILLSVPLWYWNGFLDL